MCPNIKYKELHQQDEIIKAKAFADQKAELEKTNLLVEHLSNPKSAPLQLNVISQLNLGNWLDAFTQLKSQLKGSVGVNINTDLKQELIDKQLTSEKQIAQATYETSINKIENELQSYKQDLIRQIKVLKYPAYHGMVKEYFLNTVTTTVTPDNTSKAIGATEMLQASQIPLKYINSELLRTFWQSTRIDLVSALLERYALNQKEFSIDMSMKLQEFGVEFYEGIGVQSLRQTLQYLNAFLKVVATQKTEGGTTAQLFGSETSLSQALQLGQIQSDFEKAMGWDTLLES